MFVQKVNNVYHVNNWLELKNQMSELRQADSHVKKDRKERNDNVLKINRLKKAGK